MGGLSEVRSSLKPETCPELERPAIQKGPSRDHILYPVSSTSCHVDLQESIEFSIVSPACESLTSVEVRS